MSFQNVHSPQLLRKLAKGYLLSNFIPMAFTTTNDIDIILFSKCIQHRLGHLFGHMKSFPFHWLAAVKDNYNVLRAWSGTNIPGSQSGVIINMEASKVQGPFSCWVCSDETLDWTKILPPKPKECHLLIDMVRNSFYWALSCLMDTNQQNEEAKMNLRVTSRFDTKSLLHSNCTYFQVLGLKNQ